MLEFEHPLIERVRPAADIVHDIIREAKACLRAGHGLERGRAGASHRSLARDTDRRVS